MSGPDFSLCQYLIKFLFTNSNSLFSPCLNPTEFLSFHCKEIEESNRKGKTRDVMKKIRNTKGTFHARMGRIKDRKGMNLKEAEKIKNSWKEYTEELYKKKSWSVKSSEL